MKRRNFIKDTAIAASAFSIIPSHVLSRRGNSPNDKIQIGFIGAGRQGTGLMENFVNYNEAEVISVSDVDFEKMALFSKKLNQKLTENKRSYRKIKEFLSYRELLDDKELDAVVIASPDHWHAQMSVDSAKLKKDVYSEKPLSSSVYEGRAMVDAARKYQIIFQTGSMQRSWNQFRHAVELIRNNYIGEIKTINVAIGAPYISCDLPTQPTPENINWDNWIGPAPYRGYHKDLACPIGDNRWAQWRNYFPFGGGMVTDFGAHMFDIVQWALNQDQTGPTEYKPPITPENIGLSFRYQNGVEVCHRKWGRGNNEIQFIGTEGKLEVSRSYLKTYPDRSLAKKTINKANYERVYLSNNHHKDWLNSIRKRTFPICDVEVGHRTATVCNIVNIAYALQRRLNWNPNSEKFINDPGANLMLDRTYRGKWNYRNF